MLQLLYYSGELTAVHILQVSVNDARWTASLDLEVRNCYITIKSEIGVVSPYEEYANYQ